MSSDSESSDEEDFQYDSAVDDSSEDSGEDSSDESDSEITEAQAPQVDDVCVNQFVLYKWMDEKYYVGFVSDITSSQDGNSLITLNLLQRYISRKNQVVFTMPKILHTVCIDDLAQSRCLYRMPYPDTCRRGTTFICSIKSFKVPLSKIY